MAEPPLLLDTHVWIWAVEGRTDELSASAVKAIEGAARRGRVLVPAIAVWELAMLEAKRRISLSRPLGEWVEAALRAPGVRLLELTPAIAIESGRLPGELEGDPADRMIVASARVAGARVATRDRRMVAYGRAGHVGVLDVSVG